MKILTHFIASICFLLLGALISLAQTNDPVAAGNPAPPEDLLHKLTGIYGILIVAIGWATHANWPRLLAAYEWIGDQGGALGILRKVTIGKKIVLILMFLSVSASQRLIAIDFTNTFTFKAIAASTNLAVIPFVKYDLTTHGIGYGAAGLYKVSDNFWTGLRVDRIDGRQTTAGVQAQLQQTFQINSFTITPFVEASVGLGSSSLYGSAGPGAFFRLFDRQIRIQGHPADLRFYLVGDLEHVVYTGKKSNQVNTGPIIELDF